MTKVTITGAPSEAETAAIVAAVEALWPRPAAPTTTASTSTNSWRFSGRWWAPHELVRRPRPRR
jgi:hypothetical protein